MQKLNIKHVVTLSLHLEYLEFMIQHTKVDKIDFEITLIVILSIISKNKHPKARNFVNLNPRNLIDFSIK